MRFMVMHKMTDEMEKGIAPDPAIIDGVGKLIEEGAKDKVFVSGEGLKPSSERTQLIYKNGKRKSIDGPFTEARELIGGFALMTVRSKEEALAWCDKFAAAAGGNVELILGPIVEFWDLGMAPKPDNAPLRFLSTMKMDARGEKGEPPTQQEMATMGALIEEMTKAGVLQAMGGLTSTKNGARLHFKGGDCTVIDGPFAETKELIAGYAILELPSKTVAIEWGRRFGEIVKVNVVEVREMHG